MLAQLPTEIRNKDQVVKVNIYIISKEVKFKEKYGI